MAKKKVADTPDYQVLNVDGTRYRTHSIKKYDQRRPWEKSDPNKVAAMIPGTVVKICVKEGQKVTKGRCLFILEAMKMKNRFNAEISGYISKIHVEEGEVIPKERLILEFGDPPDAKTGKSKKTKTKK